MTEYLDQLEVLYPLCSESDAVIRGKKMPPLDGTSNENVLLNRTPYPQIYGIYTQGILQPNCRLVLWAEREIEMVQVAPGGQFLSRLVDNSWNSAASG